MPPSRWIVSSNRLDKIEINYKSPESLNLQRSQHPDLEHKKAIWKLGVLIYTTLYGVVPWSYSEATGNVIWIVFYNFNHFRQRLIFSLSKSTATSSSRISTDLPTTPSSKSSIHGFKEHWYGIMDRGWILISATHSSKTRWNPLMDKEAETEEEWSKISKNLMNLKTLFRGIEHKH